MYTFALFLRSWKTEAQIPVPIPAVEGGHIPMWTQCRKRRLTRLVRTSKQKKKHVVKISLESLQYGMLGNQIVALAA